MRWREAFRGDRRPWRKKRSERRSLLDGDCRCRDPFGELPPVEEEFLLDVRDLPLVGQIGRTLEAVERLEFGQRLRQLSREIAWPLLAMLEERRCTYRILRQAGSTREILVWQLPPAETRVQTRAG